MYFKWIITLMLLSVSLYGQQVNLFTIPNQSASFLRMPSREASTDIDAVFYNPAGVTRLDNGFHFSINNQFLRQKSVVSSDYSGLRQVPARYEGVSKAPIFPSIYGAWKKERWAVMAGFNMVGGAGGASYANLPSADMGIADVPLGLKEGILDEVNQYVIETHGYDPGYNRIEGYSYDFFSEGVAYNPGIQLGAAYAINDYLSFALAGRWVKSIVKSQGYLRNIQINVPAYGGYQSPVEYLNFLSEQPDINDYYSAILKVTALIYEDLGNDRYIDVIQRGQGFTPIFGIFSRLNEKLQIGFKYESKTKIKLKTEVIDGKDGGGVYREDSTIRSDLPAFFTLGIQYHLTPRLITSLGGSLVFDKRANYNGREKYIRKNYYILAGALQYTLRENLFISGGYTYNKPNVDKEYQNEVDFRLPGHTFAAGGAWKPGDDIQVNVGVLYTYFIKETNTYTYYPGNGFLDIDPVTYNRSHEKSALLFAVGLDLKLSGN